MKKAAGAVDAFVTYVVSASVTTALLLGFLWLLDRGLTALGVDLTPMTRGLLAGIPATWCTVVGASVAWRMATDRPFFRAATPEGFPLTPRLIPEVLLGTAAGAGPILLLAAIYLAEGASLSRTVDHPVDAIRFLIAGLLAQLGLAVAEERVLREFGIQFLSRLLDARWAIVITALAFVGLRAIGPGGRDPMALLITLFLGIGLGAAYAVTGALWLPVAMRFGWGLVLGPLMGMPVGGVLHPSLFTVWPEGPTWWTGGVRGPEASYVLFGLTLTTLFGLLTVLARVPHDRWSGPGVGLTPWMALRSVRRKGGAG